MTKRIYNISGFDCPNCASKTEAHLAKDSNLSYVKIDFTSNKMYVTYKDKEYSIDELLKLIHQVEDDNISLSLYTGETRQESKIFTKEMWILLYRIIAVVIITLINIFALAKPELVWLRYGLYWLASIIISYDVYFKVIKHIKHRENIIDHNLLITIASLGALALGTIEVVNGENGIKQFGDFTLAFDDTFEAVMVVTLFQIGRIIEMVAMNKSKAAVMSAVELRVDYANLIKDGQIVKVKPEELNINDQIVITTGDLIPTDGDVISGTAYIDTSSLTGEYVPVKVEQGGLIFSGCLLKEGSLTVRVNKEYKDSTLSKIITLITESGEKKSKADDFIAKFAKWYTPVVVILSILVIIIGGCIPPHKWMEWVKIGLEILVTGCPCAIVISVPLAYFASIGLASKNGIIIKGGNYLDKLSELKKLITDKTGTLTHGSFSIQKVHPIGVKESELLHYLHAAECLSSHPVGKAICHGVNTKKLATEQKDYLEIAGKGVYTNYKGHRIYAGSLSFMRAQDFELEPVNDAGTIVYCGVDNKYIGYIVLADEIKEDAQPMVDLLHKKGVEIILLTGDKENNAKEICNKLGIDKWHSELLPEQKTSILEHEMETSSGAVAFIGDGINDAPSIIRSDIGIAMGGIGSDMAVENADIVIMNDDPAKVYDAMTIGRIARNTSIFNIVFALLVKFSVAILVILQQFVPGLVIPMFIPVLADTGLTVLLVLNSLLILYRKIRR